MPADARERFIEARERLDEAQLALVGACLAAIVHGPYIEDDDEFDAVMGVGREETEQVAASWPAPAGQHSFLVVNNALNNLLGYPHGLWRELTQETGANKRTVADALSTWRGESQRDV